jgi:hypothetical protein
MKWPKHGQKKGIRKEYGKGRSSMHEVVKEKNRRMRRLLQRERKEDKTAKTGVMIDKTRNWKGVCEKGGQDIKVQKG